MARIVAPNKGYAGVSAGISFENGEGHTDDPHRISWFRTHGYTVEEGERRESAVTPGEKSFQGKPKEQKKAKKGA